MRGVASRPTSFLARRPAAHGRVYTRDEDTPGAARVVVISHGLWQRSFGGNPAVVGQTIPIGSPQPTLVGVMPQGFKFPVEAEEVDFYYPLAPLLSQSDLTQRGGVFLDVVGKLKPGVTREQAQAELGTIGRRLAAHTMRETGTASGCALQRTSRRHEDGDVVLIGAGGACFDRVRDVANLRSRAPPRAEGDIDPQAPARPRGARRKLLTES